MGDVTTLNPILYGDLRTGEVVNRLFDHLVLTDGDGAIVPGRLTEGWTASPDRLRWELRLHPGARWHDGRPVTAADACFTLEAMLDEATGSPRRADFLVDGEPIRFEAPQPKLLRITFPAPHAPLLAALAWRPVVPRHRFAGRPLEGNPCNARPVGSGPFAFDRWEPGVDVRIRAHREHHLAPARLRRVDWQCMESGAAAVDALLDGRVDYVTDVPPALVRRVEDAPGRRVLRGLDPSFAYLGFRTDRAPFDDPRVRAAIGLAIDRERLVAEALHGEGEVAHTPVAPVSRWHAPGVARSPFDPRRAGELLDAAGWPADASGRRSLSFTVRTVARDDAKAAAAAAIARDLAAVGVQVRAVACDMGELLRAHAFTGDFEAILLGLTPGLDPSFLHAFYHSAMRPPGGWNLLRVADGALDRLLDDSQRALDPELRRTLVEAVQRRVAELAPHVLLFHPRTVDAADARLLVRPSGAANRFMYLHEWNWARAGGPAAARRSPRQGEAAPAASPGRGGA